MSVSRLTRRRAITIMAAACVTAGGAIPSTLARREWHGTALGAEGHLIFHGLDRDRTDQAIAGIIAEIDRLENVFSLYRPDSEISRLNRHARLEHPSHDLQVVLASALDFWRQSDGAFNPAIQPLWRMLADHFNGRDGQSEPHPIGDPDPGRIAEIMRVCNPADIVRTDHGIVLKPDMAITLNGIAQGYITDQVTGLLHSRGLRNTLVQLGESRALPGRSWQVGIGDTGHRIRLDNDAIATSAGHGTPFSRDGSWHHLINPKTGRSGQSFKSVSVRAPSALMADALSTALSVADRDGAARIARRFPQARMLAIADADMAVELPNGIETVSGSSR